MSEEQHRSESEHRAEEQQPSFSRRNFVGTALSVAASALVVERALAQDAAPMAKSVAVPAPVAAAPTAGPNITQLALPYADNALEPYVSANTIGFHYGKHHKAYVEKTNTLLQGTPLIGKPLEEVIKRSAKNPQWKKLFNNASQTWNHNFYWQSMKPKGGGEPTGALKARVDQDFGSYAAFREQFLQTAVDHFSNGWVWLVLDGKKLKVVDTHDADSPLLHGQKPLLTTDVWEHTYYLDYKNARKDYVNAFLDHLVHWDFAAQNLGV